MAFTDEVMELTTGTEKHLQPVEMSEEDEQVVGLERKTSSFSHGKRPDSADSSTITTTNNSSSSSFSGDGERVTIENLEVHESPEKETGFHGEHDDVNNGNVYLDVDQGIWKCRHCDWTYKEESLLCFETKGSDSSDAESDDHESQTVDHLNGEKNVTKFEKGSSSEENKGLREIDEVQNGDISEEVEVIEEEEVDLEHVKDYKAKELLENQKTPDLLCPKCKTCITKVVVLKKRVGIKNRKPNIARVRGPRPNPTDRPDVPSGDNPPSRDDGNNNTFVSFVYKCFSCFSIFETTACFCFVEKKIAVPVPDSVERVNTQPKPHAKVDFNCLRGVFRFSEPDVHEQGIACNFLGPSLVPEASRPRDNPNLLGEDVTEKLSHQKSHLLFMLVHFCISPLTLQKLVHSFHDTMEVTDSHDPRKGFNDKDDASAAGRNTSPNKGRLTPMRPSLPESTQQKMVKDDRKKKAPKKGRLTPMRPSFAVPNPVTLAEPLLTPVVEGREVEILKSIVYGGLAEAITSLGVISSAAGSGASTLSILVLGLANLFGGLILIIHNLYELKEKEPIRETTDDNVQEETRYKRLLGRRENFLLHATIAILSFIITGLLPPVVYYFSFKGTHNKDYKVASVFGASLICIALLALAKAHVKNPRSSYLKSVMYYATTAVLVSGITYVVGNVVNQLIEKYGWSDGSETPAGEVMLSLMGRKAGGFGYSSSY
ncbi:unnamed protein product [Eruca vesicaria subsp. sativa]|uniref:Membrane protein of ER body-like protein n=1 Tax=Eruca vesicaria subsp. sativa TaxID=29727 RepID=A0ABC8K145_ERUVS|nr:unnamed protein product [Eruca vesicaria subsp. sativa]